MFRICSMVPKQVVKVILDTDTPPPHTDSSTVFARWCQCAPPFLTHSFLEPIGSAVLAQFARVSNTDTQTTERATCVAIGRIYAAHSMQPNNSEKSAYGKKFFLKFKKGNLP